jgi:hypothetical protein
MTDAHATATHRTLVALRLLDEARGAWRADPRNPALERAYHKAADAVQAAGLAANATREAC